MQPMGQMSFNFVVQHSSGQCPTHMKWGGQTQTYFLFSVNHCYFPEKGERVFWEVGLVVRILERQQGSDTDSRGKLGILLWLGFSILLAMDRRDDNYRNI